MKIWLDSSAAAAIKAGNHRQGCGPADPQLPQPSGRHAREEEIAQELEALVGQRAPLPWIAEQPP